MKISTLTLSILLSAAVAPVATSQAAAKSAAKSAGCRPEAARQLVGMTNPKDGHVRSLTGAANVRRTGPADMVTQDFRSDRVTVVSDPKTGRVLRASCG